MKTTEQATEKIARQIETEESLRKYALKSTKEALIELMNKGAKENQRVKLFDINLMDLHYTIATNLIYYKTTTGDTTPLDIVYIFVKATSEIDNAENASDKITVAISDMESMFGKLGCKALNKAIRRSHKTVSKVLFKIRDKRLLVFADEFFQAIYV